MHVVDIEGKLISVTNLDQAISQCDNFRNIKHKSKCFSKLDEELNIYWNDLYNKLLKLKTPC